MRWRKGRTEILILIVSMFFMGWIEFETSFSFANEDVKRVYDEAELLTESQEANLNEQAMSLQEGIQTELYILTVEDAMGKTSVEYADDFGDERAFGYDKPYGNYMIFLIDMDNRYIWLSTSGKAEGYLTEERINAIIDAAYTYMANEKYYEACLAYLETASSYMKQAPLSGSEQRDPNRYPDTEYVYDLDANGYDSHSELTEVQRIGLCVGISLVVGGGVTGILCYQGKTKMTAGARTYERTGAFHVCRRTDQYIRTVTTKRKIEKPQSSSGSGHSGGHHTSSGGHSHGGGGRSF